MNENISATGRQKPLNAEGQAPWQLMAIQDGLQEGPGSGLRLIKLRQLLYAKQNPL